MLNAGKGPAAVRQASFGELAVGCRSGQYGRVKCHDAGALSHRKMKTGG